MTDTPQLLLAHHLKALKLPTFLREYDKLARQLFEVFSQRYERGSTVVTSNLPFDEWTSLFGSERLTGALLDRLTHHVHILQMNGDSYRSKRRSHRASSDTPVDNPIQA
jgi:hypothetical protein